MTMSEREQMYKFRRMHAAVEDYMETARFYIEEPWAYTRSRDDLKKDASMHVKAAREANRQAVRLWWRLDEKENE